MAPWVGRPRTRPAIALRREDPQVTVTASWNGATEVRAWQVLAGPRAGRAAAGRRAGAVGGAGDDDRPRDAAPFVAVAALDASGETLATSATVGVRR